MMREAKPRPVSTTQKNAAASSTMMKTITEVIQVSLRLGHTILRAKRDALLGLWVSWQERREIQRARHTSPDELRSAMQRGNLLVWLWRRALALVGLGRR